MTLLDDRSICISMAGRDTRTDIIRAGLSIMARQGFNSTGIDAVLKRANVPKGSFYHYFSSKQEFGLNVLEHFAGGIDGIFTSFLADESISPLARLKNCVDSLVDRFEQNNCSIGCLAANLGQEMADQSEEFRERLEGVFRSWIGHFERCLSEARDSGEIPADLSPGYAAECFLSGFEGALLVSKVMKSSAPLRNFIDMYFGRVLR